ncbi:transcription termination/antitermination protein NusG [Georhizobium profundi]|nr:transcription termination/antitermination NusG family protein [Georhizobium profundi]
MMMKRLETGFADAEAALRRMQKTANLRSIEASFLTMANRHQPGERRWYALVVQNGHEKDVAERLDKADIHSWIPMRKRKMVRCRGRKKPSVDAPVITGFVFVHVVPGAACFAGLRGVKDVIWIVGAGEQPMPIRLKEMEAFKDLAAGGAFDYGRVPIDAKAFKIGVTVAIKDGPFGSFKGRIEALGAGSNKDAALVLIDVLGRACPSWLPLALIKRLD